MASEIEVTQRGIDFDNAQVSETVDYRVNHTKLCDMVDKYGSSLVALATNMKTSTVKQHYRDKSGKAMISDYRIKRAEFALQEV